MQISSYGVKIMRNAALGICCLWSAEALAANVYVNTSSELTSAVAHADPGDTIIIASGAYSVNLISSRDGTSSRPITLRASIGKTVVLSAKDQTLRVLDLSGASHWRIEDLHLRGSRHAMIRIEGGTDNVISSCEIYDGSKKGIIANGDDITIQDSVFRDIKVGVGEGDTQGIAIWAGSRVTIRRNMFATPGDAILVGGAAANVTSTDIDIDDNHFHTLASWDDRFNVENAIDIKNADGVTISNNVFHRYQQYDGTDSGTAINIHTHDEGAEDAFIDDVVLEGNTFYDMGRAIAIARIYGPGSDVTLQRNVFYGITHDRSPDDRPAAIIAEDWDGLRVDNNTFVDIEGPAIWTAGDMDEYTARNNVLRRTEGIKKESGGSIDYTCRYSTPPTGGGRDVYGDQKFLDDSSHDYHLRSSSPCVDRGQKVGLTYSGAAPDIGRFEL
jgi:hypothetical protein